jgi:2-polyprenyl-6-methoxyphenol hydroxylase-like FAD-dependent oxidoreductase
MQPIKDVVIAGGGIGGLTLAVALRRYGTKVRVLERTSALAPVGAGITVQCNAMAALRPLGLEEAVINEGSVVKESLLLASSGAVLSQPEYWKVTQSHGASTVAIHRARLHQVLLTAAGPDCVQLNARVEGYEQKGDRVLVRAGAETLETDLLVGADGLHSAVRKQLLGDTPTRYSGYTSWRGIAPMPEGMSLHRVSETWGPGCRVGIVPIGHGELYWFATANAPAGGKDGDVKTELLQRFGDWHAPIRQFIEATPTKQILRTDISDRVPVQRWSDGRVVLLGDAAHATTPNLGQGGCQAIEDAVVLAQALATESDLTAGLKSYEAQRISRANGIVNASWRIGQVAQWQNPIACAFRSWLLRMTPASVLEKQLIDGLRPVVTMKTLPA